MGWTEADEEDYAFYTLIWGPPPAPDRRRLSRRERARLRRAIRDAQAAYQRMFDDLVRGATGMEIAEIEEPMALACAEIGRELSREELRALCLRATRGRRIVLPPLFPQI